MSEKQPTIQNFVASMNKSGGYARANRFAVVITPPGNLKNLINIAGQAEIDQLETGKADEHNNLFRFQSLSRKVGQQVNLHCNTVGMPGHDLQAQDMQHGSAPGRQIVQSHDYAGFIDASFYLDSYLRERHFFEQWQQMAVSNTTHKANYYDDYIGTMEIFQLDANGEITYGIKAVEVYPATIGGIEYSYDSSNTVALQSVKFQYRQWYNLTSESIAGYAGLSQYITESKTYGPSISANVDRTKIPSTPASWATSTAALKTALRNKAKGL
jgi:hypothetical protein